MRSLLCVPTRISTSLAFEGMMLGMVKVRVEACRRFVVLIEVFGTDIQ